MGYGIDYARFKVHSKSIYSDVVPIPAIHCLSMTAAGYADYNYAGY